MVQKKVVATIPRTRRVSFVDFGKQSIKIEQKLSRTVPEFHVGSPPQGADDGLISSIPERRNSIPNNVKCTVGFGAGSTVYINGKVEVK